MFIREDFNQLTAAEAERLAILAEEAGEIVQAVGKVLRHGYEDFSPFDENKVTNEINLTKEIGDLFAIVQIMVENLDISTFKINEFKEQKLERIKQWTHHQDFNN